MSKDYVCLQYSYEEPLREGLFTKEFIEEQRLNLTEMEFRTEYGAEFLEDQDTYFRYDTVMSMVQDYGLFEEKQVYA